MNRVLREAVQTFIDCAENEKSVFNLLKQGEGKVIITGTYLNFGPSFIIFNIRVFVESLLQKGFCF